MTLQQNNFDCDSFSQSSPAGAFLSICISQRAVFARRSFRLWYLAELLFGASKHLRLQSAVTLKQHTHTNSRKRRMHLECHPERPCSLSPAWLQLAGCDWLRGRALRINTLWLRGGPTTSVKIPPHSGIRCDIQQPRSALERSDSFTDLRVSALWLFFSFPLKSRSC